MAVADGAASAADIAHGPGSQVGSWWALYELQTVSLSSGRHKHLQLGVERKLPTEYSNVECLE